MKCPGCGKEVSPVDRRLPQHQYFFENRNTQHAPEYRTCPFSGHLVKQLFDEQPSDEEQLELLPRR